MPRPRRACPCDVNDPFRKLHSIVIRVRGQFWPLPVCWVPPLPCAIFSDGQIGGGKAEAWATR
jgi:hypothetical protein